MSSGLVFKGETAFAAIPASGYRYALTLRDHKMSIWLENCTSKKRWFKDGLKKADYAASGNAITGASAADYLESFHNALRCALEDSSDSSRELSTLEDDVLELTIVVKLRVFGSTWDVKNTFELTPVPGDRLDLLEVKLCAQERELIRIKLLEAKLQKQEDILNKLQIKEDASKFEKDPATRRSVVEFNATHKVHGSATLHWFGQGLKGLVETSCTGGLTVQRPGVYIVGALVKVLARAEDEDFDWGEDEGGNDAYDDRCVRLLKNGDCIQVDYSTKECRLVSPTTMTRLKAGDKLVVTCTYELEGTSTLFIQCLGN